MTRDFDAPRELVFDARTRPELIKRWLYGPPDWPLEVAERGGKPQMVFQQGVFRSVESRDGYLGGWSESFDRLETYLVNA